MFRPRSGAMANAATVGRLVAASISTVDVLGVARVAELPDVASVGVEDI